MTSTAIRGIIICSHPIFRIPFKIRIVNKLIDLAARAAVVASLALAVAGCEGDSTGPAKPKYPATIESCETNTATLCTTWYLQPNGTTYVADWSQGSHAVITVASFTSTSVSFIRNDPSGTSAGMHAEYGGTRNGNNVGAGTVIWTQDNYSFQGGWTAHW